MYFDYLKTPIGLLLITADQEALIRIDLVDMPSAKSRGNQASDQCKLQLTEYFHGQRTKFDLPIKLAGTEFQRSVWRELLNIEFAQTCSYSRIANNIDHPKAARAVGNANN